MTKVMFLVLLVWMTNCAAIKIYNPEAGEILPHNDHSYNSIMNVDSPILRSLFFNQ